MEYTITSILDMNKGAFKKQINRDVARVVDNIMDPYADPTAKRKVSIVIEFAPVYDRQLIKIRVSSKATLAGEDASSTSLLLTGDANGELQLVEVDSQLAGQMNVFGEAAETGKVLELPTGRQVN